MIFLNEQLQLIYFLQQIRGPFVDGIFRILNCFDTDYFICSLVAFIWIGCSWKWGARLGLLMIASGWVNALAKLACGCPRPFFFDSDLAIVKLHDYGFPSGGAQNAMILGCLFIYFWKSRWAWVAGISYIVLISFSRIFLGVHFPADVLGGWGIGFALFYLFIQSDRWIEQLASRFSERVTGFSLLLALLSLMFFHDFKTVFLATSLIATVIGIYFSTRYSLYLTPPSKIWKKIGLGFYGIFSACLIGLLARKIPLAPMPSIMLQVMASGLWISLFASPVIKKIDLFRN